MDQVKTSIENGVLTVTVPKGGRALRIGRYTQARIDQSFPNFIFIVLVHQSVEKQAQELSISSRYEVDKKKRTEAISNLQEKVKLMKSDYCQLSLEAHECVDSIPKLNKMVFAIQELVKRCEDLKVKYNEEMTERKKLFNKLKSLKPFKFDRVYTPKDDQVDVFADASSMVTSVLDGYNVCIFAYGQTGTGKTFTMEGTELNRGVEQELGLEIKQASKGSHQLKLKTLRRPGMYCKLEAKKLKIDTFTSRFFRIIGSDAKTLMFVQISPSDKDLDKTLSALNFATRVRGVVLGSVKMQVDTGELQKTKVMKFKVKEETYRKREEKIKELERKSKRACKELNFASSAEAVVINAKNNCSHLPQKFLSFASDGFAMQFRISEFKESVAAVGEKMPHVKEIRIPVVSDGERQSLTTPKSVKTSFSVQVTTHDSAVTETGRHLEDEEDLHDLEVKEVADGLVRLTKTNVQGERLKKAQNINRSLSALGNVIFALAAKSSYIPYRNSKLTHLLQDSLGGDVKTLMFVQNNPLVKDLDKTLSSLTFTTRVRGVVLGSVKMQVDTSELRKTKAMIKELEKKKVKEHVKSSTLLREEVVEDLHSGLAHCSEVTC
ncbi:hypothetical protein AHAS_Ahas15G0014900 [Arachis hypogaea]